MTPFWVKFADTEHGCVEAQNEQEARRLAHEITGKEVIRIDVIPYPATPRLNVHEYKTNKGTPISCPSFCYTPEECKGRTACPKSYACSE